jgi:hypothetical protein
MFNPPPFFQQFLGIFRALPEIWIFRARIQRVRMFQQIIPVKDTSAIQPATLRFSGSVW